MDVVVVLCEQPGILELQAAVIDTCADRRREPLADGEAVRRFQPSEQVLATERRTEKSGRPPAMLTNQLPLPRIGSTTPSR